MLKKALKTASLNCNTKLTKESKSLIALALKEDCVFDDITSDLTVPQNKLIDFEINPREEIIFCGKEIISEVFLQLKQHKKFKNSKINLKVLTKDGDLAKPKRPIAYGQGNARLIFAAERVILNLIQHLSGIATLTNKFVKKLDNKKIKILDTRKTLPGLRALEKQAVIAGGGKNHRFNLSDMILIKDNHLASNKNIPKTIKNKKLKVEIECDTVAQVSRVLELKPDIIMLDNMNISDIKKSIALINKKSQIEISGNVNLNNIQNFSKLEIDFISIGSLTHSAKAVDIGLDIT